MIYILLSICCSVTVGVLLKLAKRYEINISQAITFNYLFAAFFSYFFFRPDNLDLKTAPITLYFSLGILLPLIFLFLAFAIKEYGIARTDIAQRLSLFIPLVASWLLFKEDISTLKLSGLAIGLVAVYLILNRRSTHQEGKKWIYPVIVFAGFGIIDVLFKEVAKHTAVPYTTSLFYIFTLSFIISFAWLFYQFLVKKQRFQFVNFICGGILGLFNFGNILFYLKAHKVFADHPSTVFAAMNLGVIVLGSLIGLFIFKEKLNKLNFAGILMAIIAVAMITLAQLYAV